MNKKKVLILSVIILISFLILFVLTQIVYCYICNDKPSIGIKFTNVLIKIIPNNANLYLQRAEFKYYNKDLKGSIEDLEKSIEIKPNKSIAHGLLASMYFMTKTKPQNIIIEEYQKSIDLKETAQNYFNRGSYFYVIGEYDKALSDLEQAHIFSHDDYFIFLSGKILEEKGDYCKALHYYDSIENNKHHFDMYTVRREYAKYRCKE